MGGEDHQRVRVAAARLPVCALQEHAVAQEVRPVELLEEDDVVGVRRLVVLEVDVPVGCSRIRGDRPEDVVAQARDHRRRSHVRVLEHAAVVRPQVLVPQGADWIAKFIEDGPALDELRPERGTGVRAQVVDLAVVDVVWEQRLGVLQ